MTFDKNNPVRPPVPPKHVLLVLGGFGLAALGGLIYYSDRHYNSTTDPIGEALTIIGLVIVGLSWIRQRRWRAARNLEALKADNAYLEQRATDRRRAQGAEGERT